MKPIKLPETLKEKALQLFTELLAKADGTSDLKINITAESILTAQGIVKPTLFITPLAYLRMLKVIEHGDKELAWYGTAMRKDKDYLISDIFLYPQTATAATVDSDDEKCAKWFSQLPEDVHKNLKFQGHSHVNMGVTPSGRDTSNWEELLRLVKEDSFYIFCIGNKKGQFHWEIYDKGRNVYFEPSDITLQIIDNNGGAIDDWAQKCIDEYVQKPVTIPTSSSSGYWWDQDKTYTSTQPRIIHDTDTKIPSTQDFLKEVDYNQDADVYTTHIPHMQGFYYDLGSGLWECPGYKFRKIYGCLFKPAPTTKTTTKKKTTTSKKGGKK